MTRSPALSQRTTSSGLVHLGRGVLRVGVVDVEPGAVGEDDVGQAEVLVGELARVGHLARQVEAARVAQRRLLLEVPAGPARLSVGAGVGVDDLRGATIGLAAGWPGTEMPYSVSVPMTRRTLMPEPTRGRADRDRDRTSDRAAMGRCWERPRCVPARWLDRVACASREVGDAARARGLRRAARPGPARSASARGLNMPLLPRRRSRSVGAVEPSDVGLAAVGAAARAQRPCRSTGAGWTASGSPRPTRRTTPRWSTFSAVHDPRPGARRCAEVRRVLRPGGRAALPRARPGARAGRRALAAAPRARAAPPGRRLPPHPGRARHAGPGAGWTPDPGGGSSRPTCPGRRSDAPGPHLSLGVATSCAHVSGGRAGSS